MLSRLPRNAPAWLDRLSEWLEPFEVCFTHVAQRGAFRRYLLGLLSDSRRKSMSAMLERVRDPGTYQAFQHFITDAPWSADAVWRQLRATIPDRTGVLILDGTSFPKQGPHSVGVARQYCGALGKIANGQTAVTVALWTAPGVDAGRHVVSAGGVADTGRSGRAPAFRPVCAAQPKWQLALTLLRQARASGITVTAVLGDAEFGESATLRRTLHRAQMRVRLGRLVDADDLHRHPAPSSRRRRAPASAVHDRGRPWRPTCSAIEARAWAAAQPARAWRVVSWRNGTQPAWRARFCATRVTPAHDWRDRRLAPEVWLLCERALGTSDRTKFYLVHLPATASLRTLVRLTHQRWAIEQQYQELKDELGLDHFEGRTLPGWQRHVLLTALAYSWLQCERHRRGTHLPTLPIVRAVITEILTAHFFVTRPHYLRTMQKLAEIDLRI